MSVPRIGTLLLAPILISGVMTARSAAAPAHVCRAIRHEILTVNSEHEQWTSAALSIKPDDVILVYASGKVAIAGPAPRTVSPKGLPDGNGSLEMKVGTATVVPVGSRWFGSFRDFGPLQFRVSAMHRADVSGGFRVNLVVIPAETFPDPVVLGAE